MACDAGLEIAELPPTEEADGRTETTLDSLPTDLQIHLLRDAHWSARATCHTFCHSIESGRTCLHLRECGDGKAGLQRMLSRLPQLRSLGAFTDLRGLCGDMGPLALPRLTTLCLLSATQLVHLTPLTACTALVELDLSGCTAITALAPLTACSRLQHLNVSRHTHADFGPLSRLTSLHTLRMTGCCRLTSLDFLKAAGGQLEALSVDGCYCLRILDGLAACASLTYLKCTSALDITPLAACTLLTHADLCRCDDLTSVAAIASCTRLRTLNLRGCRGLADITPLSACAALTDLDLCFCYPLRDLAPLAACTALQTLQLNHCDVQDLSPLATCKALTYLNLTYCSPVLSQHCLDDIEDLYIQEYDSTYETPKWGDEEGSTVSSQPSEDGEVGDGSLTFVGQLDGASLGHHLPDSKGMCLSPTGRGTCK